MRRDQRRFGFDRNQASDEAKAASRSASRCTPNMFLRELQEKRERLFIEIEIQTNTPTRHRDMDAARQHHNIFHPTDFSAITVR